jgi:hypothetical protein
MFASLTLAVWSVLLAVCLPPPAAAQRIEPGARVRGQTADSRFDGWVAWTRGDSLALTQDGRTAVYLRSRMTTLELASGTRRNTLLGLGIGAAAGVVGGLIVLSLREDDAPPSELDDLSYGYAAVVLAGATAVGGITGALIKSPRWTRVRLSGLGVSITL